MGGMGGPAGAPGMPPPAKAAPEAEALPQDMKKVMDSVKESESKDGKGDKHKRLLGGVEAKPDGEVLTYFDDDRSRALVRQLYRKLDPTMEWAENNYYKLRIAEQTGALVGVGPFWVDYAKHAGDAPFLSRHLADASRNFTEMMFALSVLDLPFEAAKHKVAFDGGKMTFDPAGPVIAFHEEVRRTDAADGKVPVLVGQNFYRPTDRHRARDLVTEYR